MKTFAENVKSVYSDSLYSFAMGSIDLEADIIIADNKLVKGKKDTCSKTHRINLCNNQ